MPKREKKQLTYKFNDPNPPGVLEQKLAEMATDNLIIMLKKYPSDIANILGHKIITSLDKEQLINLALCDANKFEPKLDETK